MVGFFNFGSFGGGAGGGAGSVVGDSLDIVSYVGETTCDPIGTPDYTTTTIEWVWEPPMGITQIATVDNAGSTKTVTTTKPTTIPVAVRERARQLKYSCRDAGTKEVLFSGRWTVYPAALKRT